MFVTMSVSRRTPTAVSRTFALRFILGVVMIGLPVPMVALAQSAPTGTTTEATIPTATPAVPVSWYQSDWLTGSGVDQGDFVVGPGKVEVEVRPGQSVTKIVTLTNRISNDRTFEIVVEDISAGADGASVKLLGAERGPYTLRDYISIPGDRLTLGLGERAQIPITISIPENADPGGKYGSVFFTTVRDEGTDSDGTEPATRSPIIARLGILFFVTVPGDIKREGETVDLSLVGKRWWYEEGPIRFGISYENRGSVHLNPYGEVRITNMFGEEVGYQELDPWFVLPRALRTREHTWDRDFLLGRYTATVAINRGYDDVVDTLTVSFWVLPWKIVGGVFLAFFIIFLVIRTFFRTFEFKRKGS